MFCIIFSAYFFKIASLLPQVFLLSMGKLFRIHCNIEALILKKVFERLKPECSAESHPSLNRRYGITNKDVYQDVNFPHSFKQILMKEPPTALSKLEIYDRDGLPNFVSLFNISLRLVQQKHKQRILSNNKNIYIYITGNF